MCKILDMIDVNEYGIQGNGRGHGIYKKLKNEVDMLYNVVPTEKTNGTEIYIDDAKKCRLVNTEIDGMYKQDGTTGKQLANFKNVSNVAIVDGTANLSTKTAGFTAQFNIDKLTLPAGNYCFYFATNEYGNGSTQNLTINENVVGTFNFLTKGYNYCDFILAEDITFSTLKLWLGSESYNKTLKEISLIQGTHTNISGYEKYTGGIASPNPDYPQEIEQVESVKLQCTGSNLLDYTKILSTPSTTSGITIKLEENGNITISGKPKYSYFSVIQSKDIIDILKDGETYYLDQSNYNRYFYTEIQCVKADGSIIYKGPQKSCESFKVDKSLFKKYVIRIIGGSLTNWGKEERTVTSNFKLTRQKNLPFEKYIEKTVNIDLKGNKLCAVSDTIKDKLLIDKKGNVALQKNVEYVKFTSKDGWQTNGSTDNRHGYITPVLNILPNTNQKNCISNIAMISGTTNSNINVVLAGTTAASKLRLYIPKKFLNTELSQLEALNELLQKAPMELYYESATPETIDLGQIDEIPSTFEGTNNIWAETNLGNTEIEIEYVQDVKKLIEQTQAMIVANASEEVTE